MTIMVCKSENCLRPQMRVSEVPLLSLLVCCAVLWMPPRPSTAQETFPSPDVPRLIALGDLHGDIALCRDLLKASGMIDASDRWIGGRSIVVQLGDIIDRGRHHHEIYDLFASLEVQARDAGGEFTFLIGNHELMNLLGNFHYVNPDVVAVFGGIGAYAAAFAPRGVYGAFILRHPVVLARLGVVFVHGGVMPDYARLGLDAINAAFRAPFAAPAAPLRHPFSQTDSPLWARRVLREGAAGNCTLLDASLRLLADAEAETGRAAPHVMVAGHTIQPNGTIAVLCGDRLVGAETGLSRYLLHGGHAAYVEFVLQNNRRVPVPVYPFGKGKPYLLRSDVPPQPPRAGKGAAKREERRETRENGMQKAPEHAEESVEKGFSWYLAVAPFIFFLFVGLGLKKHLRHTRALRRDAESYRKAF